MIYDSDLLSEVLLYLKGESRLLSTLKKFKLNVRIKLSEALRTNLHESFYLAKFAKTFT